MNALQRTIGIATIAAIALTGGPASPRTGPQAAGGPDASAAPLAARWLGWNLLSRAGISMQVPAGWGRGFGLWPEGLTILEAGTGNVGLGVIRAPVDEPDLGSAVDAILALPELAGRRPDVRVEVMHGTHRAILLRGGDV